MRRTVGNLPFADANLSTVVQKTVQHLQELKEDIDLDEIKQFVKVSLTFKVLAEWMDPYHNLPSPSNLDQPQ